MSVQTGERAPDFALYDDQMQLFRRSDYLGERVLLLFFPGAFSSVCTTELNAVNNDLDRYVEQDVRVVGISTDSTVVLQEFKRVNRLRFSLLSDHDAKVAAAFGAKYNHDFTPMKLDRIAKRAAFLIDREGVVRYAEVLDDADKMPDLEAIHAAIQALRDEEG
jgi:peroxiredoxin